MQKSIGEIVRIPFQELMEKEFSGEFLIEKLREELEAKETKFFAHEGHVNDKRDVIAWRVRQIARQDAHRLRGDYPAEKHEIEQNIVYLAPKQVKKPKETGK